MGGPVMVIEMFASMSCLLLLREAWLSVIYLVEPFISRGLVVL